MVKSSSKNKHGHLKYLQFGPVLAGTSVAPELIKELLERGEKTTVSSVPDLAGHLEKENEFNTDDYVWFIENFKNYFLPYFKKLQKTDDPDYFYGMKRFNRVLLNKLWINYMRQNEYNPPHTHSGSFSFVLYLDVPDAIEDEIRNFKGTGLGPGTISFTHGEEQKGIINNHGVRPLTGDLWMFPATLSHMVPPFRSDVTRISVSGNFYITDHINRNHPLQPGEFLVNQPTGGKDGR